MEQPSPFTCNSLHSGQICNSKPLIQNESNIGFLEVYPSPFWYLRMLEALQECNVNIAQTPAPEKEPGSLPSSPSPS